MIRAFKAAQQATEAYGQRLPHLAEKVAPAVGNEKVAAKVDQHKDSVGDDDYADMLKRAAGGDYWS
jgi:hypothetical protein